jgi:hypothetical protein
LHKYARKCERKCAHNYVLAAQLEKFQIFMQALSMLLLPRKYMHIYVRICASGIQALKKPDLIWWDFNVCVCVCVKCFRVVKQIINRKFVLLTSG